MKSLMNRYVKLLSFLPGICLIVACTGHQIKGYEINGSAPLPEFEGKMVYMKDVSNGQPVDSAEIIHGKFDFSDTVTIVSPVVKVLSIRASKLGLEYRLPVVIENGSIQAYISDVVCTGGTMLNERMQDFLMAVDEYSTACENKQTEQIKSGFADLLKKYIEINDDNAVGEYIRTAYRSSL
ncbi:DUF4369 domain-containing protein [Bacteroides xylanisolvens]|uniref:DUF4369 domain-containing protein n=1 Tax=Bacteroides xylanisolvens TaxID=371601 RepID=UPI001F5A8AFC|nr:DUF4369 domain-containing protein [Bacteroides xylanisolvens]